MVLTIRSCDLLSKVYMELLGGRGMKKTRDGIAWALCITSETFFPGSNVLHWAN